MINTIVNTFYKIAEQHKLIRSFKYEQLSKAAGIGNELMPQLFVEDPLLIDYGTLTNGTMRATVNIDIVCARQNLENKNLYPESQSAQSLCYSIALNILAKLREMIKEEEAENILGIISFSFLTLRRWYDNNADGIRMTVVLNIKNEINFCDLDEHFDPRKEFEFDQYLPIYNTDDAIGCAVFNGENKLPTFKL